MRARKRGEIGTQEYPIGEDHDEQGCQQRDGPAKEPETVHPNDAQAAFEYPSQVTTSIVSRTATMGVNM